MAPKKSIRKPVRSVSGRRTKRRVVSSSRPPIPIRDAVEKIFWESTVYLLATEESASAQDDEFLWRELRG